MASAEDVLANAHQNYAHSMSIAPCSTTSTALVVATRLLVASMTSLPLVSVGVELERVESVGRIKVTALPGGQTLMDFVVGEDKGGTHWAWSALYGNEPETHDVLVEFCTLNAGDAFVFSGAITALVVGAETSAIDLLGRLAD